MTMLMLSSILDAVCGMMPPLMQGHQLAAIPSFYPSCLCKQT